MYKITLRDNQGHSKWNAIILKYIFIKEVLCMSSNDRMFFTTHNGYNYYTEDKNRQKEFNIKSM